VHPVGFIWERLYRDARSTKHKITDTSLQSFYGNSISSCPGFFYLVHFTWKDHRNINFRTFTDFHIRQCIVCTCNSLQQILRTLQGSTVIQTYWIYEMGKYYERQDCMRDTCQPHASFMKAVRSMLKPGSRDNGVNDLKNRVKSKLRTCRR